MSEPATEAGTPRAPASLEPPTGRRAVRGPTLFVLGLVIAVALAAIVRTCVEGA